MPTLKADKQFKSAGETRNCFVDFSGKLASGETISNTTYSASTDLTLSVVQATTAAYTINGSTVSTAQAAQFRVAGGTASTLYDITITVTTSASQTLMGICPLKVIANSA